MVEFRPLRRFSKSSFSTVERSNGKITMDLDPWSMIRVRQAPVRATLAVARPQGVETFVIRRRDYKRNRLHLERK